MTHKTGNYILDIRVKVAIDFETENYKTLHETYRKKFTLQNWIDTQAFGRLFLTGTKHNYVWAKFWSEYYDQCYSIAYSVVKDRDTADRVVCNQFDYFRNRKKYGNAELYDMKTELKKKIEKKDKSFNKDERDLLKKEIETLRLKISDFDEKLSNLYFEQEAYKGKSDSEIYKIELEKLTSQDVLYDAEGKAVESAERWFKAQEPNAGYVLMCVRHTAMMEYNKINKGKIINISSIITHSSNKSMSDGDLTDMISESKLEVDEIFDTYLRNINDVGSIKNFESTKIESYEFENLEAIPRQKLSRAKELYELSKTPEILLDFFFNNFTHNQLYKKYGYNTSGAVKSIVSRANRFVVSVISHEVETEQIINKEKEDGIIRFYYQNTYGCLKESCEIQNRQRHGENILYFENGNIKKKQSWCEGKLYGKYTEYYENKKIKQKGEFINGEKFGEWCDYSESNKIEEKRIYNGDGCYSYIIYDENGKIEEKGHINGFGNQIIDFSKSM